MMSSTYLRQAIATLTLVSFVATVHHTAARAQATIEAMNGAWAVSTPSKCGTASYQLRVSRSASGTVIDFTDQANRINREQVVAEQTDGFTTATVASTSTQVGARWDYTIQSRDTVLVRNLSNGRVFPLVRCSGSNRDTVGSAVSTPVFSDPLALVAWLLGHSNNGFDPADDAANANVFSPGLREALRASYAHSKLVSEPPCGANGNIILSTQETGKAMNTRLAVRATAPDRATVSASFDVDGYHRDKRFLAVNLDGAWKLENILDSDGASLRRSLACR